MNINDRAERIAGYVFILIFAIMSVGIAITGFLHYRNYERNFRANVESQLSSIAQLKVGELAMWRRERLGDGAVLFKNAAFSASVRRFFEKPKDEQAQQELRAWLGKYHTANRYSRVALYDTQGIWRMSAPQTQEAVDFFIAHNISEILSAGQVVFQDFHQNAPNRPIHLAVVVPILDETEKSRPLGVLVLNIDPATYLYPFISRWPAPSQTAETFLVRKEGNDAVFLNEIRFHKNAPLNLRIPLAKRKYPAVRAVLGETGIVEGIDYRGAPVIAAMSSVPDSPWHLVAKISAEEVYAPTRERLWQTLVFFGVLILGSGFATGFIWRWKSERFYRERLMAVEALREAEEGLQATLDAIPDLLFELGLDGRYYDYRASRPELLAAPPETFLGRRVAEVLPSDVADVILSALRVANEHGQSFGRQFEIRLPQGNSWFELSIARKSTLPGQEPRFIVLSRDITARKQAEIENARLAAAVAHSADAVIITDPNGGVEYVNPAFEKITGYRLDEVRGKTPRVIKSGMHDRAFYEDLWRTIKAGQVWRGRVVNRKKDGSLYDEEMIISSIADAAGAIVNFVAVKRDVTRETALQKSRDYFTSITSHELRTPLQKIHVVDYLLGEMETGGLKKDRIEKARGALRESVESFERIVNVTSIISDMTLSGPERRFVRHFPYHDLVAALESARINIGEARRDIRIETDMTDFPRSVAMWGNHAMILQALDEALSNAIKYTPDGKAVHVRAHVSGGSAYIEVADEGDGIPEDKLLDALTPYYSLENPLNHSTSRYKFNGGGLGLGLTVAKLIMEYHSGSLVIGARNGCAGTLLVLSFPLASKEALSVEAVEESV